MKGSDGRRLESEIRLEVLRDFANETLEGKLADQKLSRLLVSTDFTKCDGTRAVTMGLLDASRSERVSNGSEEVLRGGRFASSLGCELFTRGLATGGLTSSLLGTSHWSCV